MTMTDRSCDDTFMNIYQLLVDKTDVRLCSEAFNVPEILPSNDSSSLWLVPCISVLKQAWPYLFDLTSAAHVYEYSISNKSITISASDGKMNGQWPLGAFRSIYIKFRWHQFIAIRYMTTSEEARPTNIRLSGYFSVRIFFHKTRYSNANRYRNRCYSNRFTIGFLWIWVTFWCCNNMAMYNDNFARMCVP